MAVRVQAEDFDLGTELAAMRAGRTDIGALVSFTGLVRDDTGDLQALELEHYPGMTENVLENIVNQALQRWPLDAVRIIHRIGELHASDQIVLVGVSSAHRIAAYEASQFIMDI